MDFLANEILINIFEFLDSVSLQNVMEVSNRWFNIVTMTSSIKTKLILSINANTCEEMAKKSLNFLYRNIKITSNTFDDYPFADFVAYKGELAQFVEFQFTRNIETVFLNHSKHLNVLELTKMNSIFIANILTSCKNLRTLKLDSVNENQFRDNFYSQDLRTPETIRLSNLKYLEVKSSSDIFSRIEAAHLQTLIMHDDPGCDVLRNFLVICWDLKHLELYEFNLRSVRRPQIFRFKLEKFAFQLKYNMNLFRTLINNRLAFEGIMQHIRQNFAENEELMRNHDGRNLVYARHVEEFRNEIQRNQQDFLGYCLMNFLGQQKKSLKDLNINFDGLNLQSTIIMDSLLGEFNLTKLSIKSDCKTLNLLISNTNSSITTLEIFGILTFDDIKEIVTKCPAVTNLKINLEAQLNSDVLSVIASSMTSLKTLKINTFFVNFSEQANLENVEKLTIFEVSSNLGKHIWHKIARSCPNVISLTLIDNFFAVTPKDMQKVMRKLTKIENLEFVGKGDFLGLKNLCGLFFDKNCSLKKLNIIGRIKKAEFDENIAILAKCIKTRITVIEA